MRTDVFVDQEHVVLVRLAPLLIPYHITAYPPLGDFEVADDGGRGMQFEWELTSENMLGL